MSQAYPWSRMNFNKAYWNVFLFVQSVSDEDYWSSSTATKIKAKGVNIFDESVVGIIGNGSYS